MSFNRLVPVGSPFNDSGDARPRQAQSTTVAPATGSDLVICVHNVSKCYHIYETARDRAKQLFVPRIQRFFGITQKRYFHEFWALKGISLDVRKGEAVGVIGRNGSGKSTLLQIICGTLTPTGGSVEARGRMTALLELGSGFNPEFTGRENIYLNGAIIGLAREEIERRFDAIAAFADIGDFLNRPVKTYSSGMVVRLAFAISACVDPDILVVDEALAVGDSQFVHKCMDRIRQLQNSGTSILLVTHDGSTVKTFCNRAYCLDAGAIRFQGESAMVVDDYVASLFGTPVVKARTGVLAPPSQSPSGEPPEIENHIPNIDRRLGDQRANVVGVGLYDASGRATRSIYANSRILIRYSVRNQDLDPQNTLCFGYVFRNWRGDEIAASNTEIEGLRIEGFSAPGECITVSAHVAIPSLYPGNYAISIGVAYREGGDLKIADRIINAITVEIGNSKRISTLINFDTSFELSRGSNHSEKASA